MDLSDPVGSVIPSAQGPVLEVLAGTHVALSGRAIAALTDGKVSHTRARQVLRDLVSAGLVLQEVAPPAYLYLLNRQHLAAEAICALATMRTRLLAQMRAGVQAWATPARAIWLFGSVARGTSTAASDIDVLVVRPAGVDAEDLVWLAQLTTFAESVQLWTGNRCELLEYGDDELIDALSPRLVSDLREHGLALAGESPARRLRPKHAAQA